MNNRETESLPAKRYFSCKEKQRECQRHADQRRRDLIVAAACRRPCRTSRRAASERRILRELLSAKNGKGPGLPRAFAARQSAPVYFSDVLIEVNLVFRLEPRPFTTVMIASEMPAAIRPYSMAVAPDWSFTKRAIRLFIGSSMCTRGWSTTLV